MVKENEFGGSGSTEAKLDDYILRINNLFLRTHLLEDKKTRVNNDFESSIKSIQQAISRKDESGINAAVAVVHRMLDEEMVPTMREIEEVVARDRDLKEAIIKDLESGALKPPKGEVSLLERFVGNMLSRRKKSGPDKIMQELADALGSGDFAVVGGGPIGDLTRRRKGH